MKNELFLKNFYRRDRRERRDFIFVLLTADYTDLSPLKGTKYTKDNKKLTKKCFINGSTL